MKRIEQDLIKMSSFLRVKTPYFCPILMKVEFSRLIFENSQILNFMEIRPMGAELFHADRRTYGQTDMTKLIVALFFFCNFSNAPKNYKFSLHLLCR